MTVSDSAQGRAVARFRELHESGCFVLPNPWNVGTARFLERAGFCALATTSAGLSFALGRPDSATSLSLEEVLANTREIVEATTLPVNADFQAAYATDANGVFRHVGACVATGVAGLSIEDASADPAQPLFERARAVERVQAAREAIDRTGSGVLLTGRCEAWLVGEPDPLATALDRLVAYAEAGADCLYAPGVHRPDEISQIVRAVSPRPVNVLLGAPRAGLSLPRLAELGVRRVSTGSALARVAWGALMRAGAAIAATGSFDALADAASFAELDALFQLRTDAD